MKKLLVFGLAACVTAFGAVVFAGEENEGPKPQMFVIYKDVVHPSKTTEYEAAIKHMISEFTAYNIDPEKMGWRAVSGPEMGYVYLMPIENFAGIDRMHEDWEAAMAVIGAEKIEAMMTAVTETMEHVEVFHVQHRADLSYMPEEPTLKPEDVKYVQYGFYYVMPGKKKVMEEVAKQFAELYKANNVETGWSIYESLTGNDLPLFVVAHPARSQAEFYQQREALRAAFGDDSKKLSEKVMQAVRRVELKDGWTRGDLSYPATEETTEN